MSKKESAPVKMKESESPGELYSTLDHPVELSYGTESMIVPSRALKVKIPNHKLLGALPKGITLKKLSK